MTTLANQAAHAEKVQLVEAFRTACRQWNGSDPATDNAQLLAAEGNALYLSARALVQYLERNESRQPPHCYSDCMAAMQSLQRSATPSLEGLRDRLFDEPLPARDSDGHCYHPAIPDTDEEVNIVMLLAAFGVACTLVSMESDAPVLHDTLLEAGGPDFSAWNPTPPAGDGWKLLALYDTENGPYALFGRKDHSVAFPKRAAEVDAGAAAITTAANQPARAELETFDLLARVRRELASRMEDALCAQDPDRPLSSVLDDVRAHPLINELDQAVQRAGLAA